MSAPTRSSSGRWRSRRVPLVVAAAATAVAAAAALVTTAGATTASSAAAKAPAPAVNVAEGLAYAPAQPAGSRGPSARPVRAPLQEARPAGDFHTGFCLELPVPVQQRISERYTTYAAGAAPGRPLRERHPA